MQILTMCAVCGCVFGLYLYATVVHPLQRKRRIAELAERRRTRARLWRITQAEEVEQ